MPFLSLRVQEALKAAGFTIQQTPLHSSGWLAYNSDIRIGQEACTSNGKPPLLIVNVTDATVQDIRIRSVEFDISGQVPSADPSGLWVKSTVYGFTFNTPEDVINAIPTAVAIGSAVWAAAFRASQDLLAPPVEPARVPFKKCVLTKSELRKIDKPTWCAVGKYIENEQDDVPDLIVACDDEGRAFAVAKALEFKLNNSRLA